ncbi:chitinase [Kutzneria albida]|uniref:Sugar hydrolase n=1 Tax=Kutzneria albida DSM 43870 TaxID=1449976 RepID=W5VZP3_9PSEU|nr:chitinase [Kutzneria albida]AHH94393.1 sugar hydrolase [Kutzneria albida DSM 43870]
MTSRNRALLVGGVLTAAVAVGMAAAFQAGTDPAHAAQQRPAAAGSTITVAPYVDMGLSADKLAQFASSGGIKSFSLAFVTSAGCKASWFNAHDIASGFGLDQIGRIRAAGGDVKVSFGGATGIELAQACTDVKALAAEYDSVVKKYSLTHIDLDIEGAAVADPGSVQRRSQALSQVQKANPGLKVSLTLPVLPSGLTQDGVNVVKAAKDAGVDVDLVNIMSMDFGTPESDMGARVIESARSTQKQLKQVYPELSDAQAFKKLGITPMLGVNDTQTEVFSQANAKAVVAFANAQHVGYLGYWEQTRDANACTGALFQCTNIAQQPFEFAKIFAGFTG